MKDEFLYRTNVVARRAFALPDTIPNAFIGTKQSPVFTYVSFQKEVASPPKYKSGGSQRHQFIKCTVERDELSFKRVFYFADYS